MDATSARMGYGMTKRFVAVLVLLAPLAGCWQAENLVLGGAPDADTDIDVDPVI